MDTFVKLTPAIVAVIGVLIAAISLAVTIFIFRRQSPDRAIQRRRAYVDLEFEASRIFRLCVDHPEIISYLEGALETSSRHSDEEIHERAYWYSCQVLNVFEVMISFRIEKMVETDVFNTWVSWFHELGTFKNFPGIWSSDELWSHYKEHLQDFMNYAIDLREKRTSSFDYDAELRKFHVFVGEKLNDTSVVEHFDRSLEKIKSRRRKIEESEREINIRT